MRTVFCKLNCREKATDVLHMRPISYLIKLNKWFPLTSVRFGRAKGRQISEETVDGSAILEILAASFYHGDEIGIQVSGQCEVLASEIFKVVLENLEGFSDDQEGVSAKLAVLVDKTCIRIDDPDLSVHGNDTVLNPMAAQAPAEEEARCVATINDRLHNLSLPMLPVIAKHFDSPLEILFEAPNKGIYRFSMNPENGFELDYDQILRLEVEAGTRITVLNRGTNRIRASNVIKNVLTNLWQCDEWVRNRAKGLYTEVAIREFIDFATSMGRQQSAEYEPVFNPNISDLLSDAFVFINDEKAEFTKDDALTQLAAPHARKYDLDSQLVLECLKEAERREPVVLREGFALAHAAMDHTPRISISFGVYPTGIIWSGSNARVRLVCMVIFAKDTYGTWRDYLKKLGILFRTYASLQTQLLQSKNSEGFRAALRRAETAMVK
jgi:mannitol/fructose-specific phosphotransferase system IIA component (Ntr-type)/phosphotransferase system HPr-like phosphotransfer protein